MRVTVHPYKKPRIEIVPLIDVIFFLLATFVMVSLSMVRPASAMASAKDDTKFNDVPSGNSCPS